MENRSKECSKRVPLNRAENTFEFKTITLEKVRKLIRKKPLTVTYQLLQMSRSSTCSEMLILSVSITHSGSLCLHRGSKVLLAIYGVNFEPVVCLHKQSAPICSFTFYVTIVAVVKFGEKNNGSVFFEQKYILNCFNITHSLSK